MDDDFDTDSILAASAERPQINERNPTNGAALIVQPKPQALPSRQTPSAILVSTRQKGNPILNHVKSLPWEYSDTPADYILGATTCALFLSLKYHRLHPEYIYSRIRALGQRFNLRILLAMVDISNHEESLRELAKTGMVNNLTLILCWSAAEAGRYLELFKSYEHASPASIRAHGATTYRESLTEFVTTPRSINKTDAASLIGNFGSLRAAVNARPEELVLVPGWGEKKVKEWCAAVREGFRVQRAVRRELGGRTAAVRKGERKGEDGERLRSMACTPVPISMAMSGVSSEGSGVAVVRPENGQKRRRMIEDSNMYDEEPDVDALLAEAEEEAVLNSIALDEPVEEQTAKKTYSEPELSEGVVAALAKLRENG